MRYPVRARIVDVVGDTESAAAKLYAAMGFKLNTPAVSKPHVGKEGLAEEVGSNVRITLDDGTIIWGYECWWEPLHD